MNVLSEIAHGQITLTWKNAPDRWEWLPNGAMRVYAPAQTDLFCNPNGATARLNAPFLPLAVTGDFVARLHVRPTFNSTYDAGALLVYIDDTHWAKLCFEATDFGTHAAVSVVTNTISDDANGTDLDTPDLWLQIVRQGQVLAQHYALDGLTWRMVRYFSLPLPPTVLVGPVVQSPVGHGTIIDLLDWTHELRPVSNLRAGV